MIGEVFSPISEYKPFEKTLEVQYLLDPQQAIEVNEAQFFQLMLRGLIVAMEVMDLPEGFDFENLRNDLLGLQFEQLPESD